MRVGVSLPSTGPFARPEYITSFARTCDDLRYDGLWTSDHVTWTREDARHLFQVGSAAACREEFDPNYYEPLATLAYLAGVTKHVRLGTGVLVLPLRNPVLVAKQVATLDQLSNGRLKLGVGVGGTMFADRDFRAIGAPEMRRHRGALVDEWIEIMRCIWREEVGHYSGAHLTVAGASAFPKPLQAGGPPLLIGGDSPAALRRVAKYGDGWIVSTFALDEIAQRRSQLAEWAETYGRSDHYFEFTAQRWLCIADDQATAVRKAAATVGSLRRGGEAITLQVEHLVGTVEHVHDLVAKCSEGGVDELILRVVGDSPTEVLETLDRFRREAWPVT